MTDPFPDHPDAARLWLAVLDGPADEACRALAGWLPSWTSHGRPVAASVAVLDERVLAVAARIPGAEDQPNAGVSGCGVDAMEHAMAAALTASGRTAIPALHVTWRSGDGSWHTESRPVFRRLAAEGHVGPETQIVDVTPATVGALRAAGGALRPAAATWAARAFRLAQA